jgi:hypothetical protein
MEDFIIFQITTITTKPISISMIIHEKICSHRQIKKDITGEIVKFDTRAATTARHPPANPPILTNTNTATIIDTRFLK